MNRCAEILLIVLSTLLTLVILRLLFVAFGWTGVAAWWFCL